MLDSSPVALPPARRPLKRSASTASLASLPTPPRTHRKHARGRSRGSCDSDSDDHAVLSSSDEAPDARKTKKRRTAGQAPHDEDAFWLGGAAGAATTEPAMAGSSKASGATAATAAATSKAHTAPLLYRRMLVQQQQQQQAEVAPVSPPPSHRRAAAVASLKPESASDTASSPPTTPRTRSATKRAALLLRDSPGNPFLATPEKATVEDSASPSPSVSSANPSPHTPNHHEKPTLTYVFRGVRRTYQNPLYNHAEDRPLSPPPASLLPIEHPEYSPPITCTPKLLFPAARRTLRSKKAAAPSRARSPSLSGDERGGAGIRPQKLDFGTAGDKDGRKATAPQVQGLDQKLKTAGEDVFL